MPIKRSKVRIDIVCLFPQILSSFFSQAIIQTAQKKGLVEIKIHDLRKWSKDKRKTVDDKPYGGGPGMILKLEPLVSAYRQLYQGTSQTFVILTSPAGLKFDQKMAERLSQKKHLLIFCGRYEGVDQRFIDRFVDEEISIGDYVLSGGELPAAVLVEAVARLIPGIVGNRQSLREETFTQNFLEYSQYTRPSSFEGKRVPKILLSGHHQKIKDWREKKSLEKTRRERPDLLKS